MPSLKDRNSTALGEIWEQPTGMSKAVRLDISLAPISRDCRVQMNGVDISHFLRAITVEAKIGDITRVTLDIIPSVVELHGDAFVKLVVDAAGGEQT